MVMSTAVFVNMTVYLNYNGCKQILPILWRKQTPLFWKRVIKIYQHGFLNCFRIILHFRKNKAKTEF